MSLPIQVPPETSIIPFNGLVQITFDSPDPMPLKLSVECVTMSPSCQSCAMPAGEAIFIHGGKFVFPVSARAQAGCTPVKSPDKPCQSATCGSRLLPSRYDQGPLGFVRSLQSVLRS